MRQHLLSTACATGLLASLLGAMIGIAGRAQANPLGIPTPSPNLPVLSSPGFDTGYAERALQLCFQTQGPNVCLSNGVHQPFGPIQISFTGGNEVESFGSTFSAYVSLNNVPVGPVTLQNKLGTTTNVTVFARTSDTQLGTFATQISFDLTGTLGAHTVEVMTDPTPTSTGTTTVSSLLPGDPTDVCGPSPCTNHINSFFDVFTELSLDGGPFVPLTNGDGPGGSAHVDLEFVPEPGSFALLAAGLVGLGLLRRRRVT